MKNIFLGDNNGHYGENQQLFEGRPKWLLEDSNAAGSSGASYCIVLHNLVDGTLKSGLIDLR